MFLIKEIWFNKENNITSTKVSGNYDIYKKETDKDGNSTFKAWNCEIPNWSLFMNLSSLNEVLKGLYIMNDKGQTIEKIK